MLTRNSKPWRYLPARIVLTLAVLATLPAVPVRGDEADQAPRQEEVKAAYLFKFFSFVEWPDEATNGDYRLGVLGDSPILPVLEKLAGREVRGRRLVVHHFRRLDELEYCHILFVAPSAPGGLDRLLDRLAGVPTLTVGEQASFAEQGGMVGFFLEEKRVRFAINLDVSRDAGLSISSNLLRLAKVYRKTKK